jgi:hypothetical protein
LIVRIYYPLGRVGAVLSCEWSHIPGLNLSGGYVVRAAPPVVAVIVDVEIVAACGLLSDVFDRRDYVERLPRRYFADRLADL